MTSPHPPKRIPCIVSRPGGSFPGRSSSELFSAGAEEKAFFLLPKAAQKKLNRGKDPLKGYALTHLCFHDILNPEVMANEIHA